jgi:hypothetical protein
LSHSDTLEFRLPARYILLVALACKLGLPPVDRPGAPDREANFFVLRAADAGDLAPLSEFWLRRLERA